MLLCEHSEYRCYHGSVVPGPAYVLSSVQPVHQAVQRVVADRPDVPQHVDGQDDVRTLLSQHHPADAGLLTEEQETGGGCRQRGREDSEETRYMKSLGTVALKDPDLQHQTGVSQ
ncbi:hypothetical protein F7725_022234 [Dissostichus mawsoni]|uniref:Uncharacterized protein n=1 Tax=Dissostichus mawsoni TaxID=36200 RepID=A0A7J5YZF7_DISMA|nr:hypothetical protein F7725_022234 [Dissostichus mawsoni]